MTLSSRMALAGMLLAASCLAGGAAVASDGLFPTREDGMPLVHKAQMRGLLEMFADDGDDYGYDRRYDFDRYRNSTSRKERIRDYYQMQKDMQKDYWKGQKEMQKNAIKRQRGW